jgi:hypothetical protein
LDVRADGHQQVLRITKYEQQYSVYKARRPSAHDRRASMASGSEAFEAVTEVVAQNLSLQIEFTGIGISLMNRKMTEVIYMTIGALKFEYTDSNIAQTVNLSCGSLQIDNQLHDAIYPVILQPTPIDKESSGLAAPPTVQGSVVWLKDQGANARPIHVTRSQLSALRTRGFVHQVLLDITSSTYDRSGRRPAIGHLRLDSDPRGVMGGRNGRVSVSFYPTRSVAHV